jgi:hypothetical protein
MVQFQSIKSGGQELTVASSGRRTMPMIPPESWCVAAGRPDSGRVAQVGVTTSAVGARLCDLELLSGR